MFVLKTSFGARSVTEKGIEVGDTLSQFLNTFYYLAPSSSVLTNYKIPEYQTGIFSQATSSSKFFFLNILVENFDIE